MLLPDEEWQKCNSEGHHARVVRGKLHLKASDIHAFGLSEVVDGLRARIQEYTIEIRIS